MGRELPQGRRVGNYSVERLLGKGGLSAVYAARQALIDALYVKDALHLAYDAEATRTAAEAFDARAGNCLSLVLMTAAFARHLELPVSYQQVLVDEEYTRAGDLYFASGHVNVMLGRHGPPARVDEAHWLVIDFLPQLQLRGQRTIEIAEDTVVAMFLNNRAAEALARGAIGCQRCRPAASRRWRSSNRARGVTRNRPRRRRGHGTVTSSMSTCSV